VGSQNRESPSTAGTDFKYVQMPELLGQHVVDEFVQPVVESHAALTFDLANIGPEKSMSVHPRAVSVT
jgi:hypothetical protein